MSFRTFFTHAACQDRLPGHRGIIMRVGNSFSDFIHGDKRHPITSADAGRQFHFAIVIVFALLVAVLVAATVRHWGLSV